MLRNRDTLYFEVAWEVVNKVGGIYAVLKTKAPVTVNELGQNYFMLGTYDPRFASTDVEINEPTNPKIISSIESMRLNGIKVYYGKWLIDGYPNVILFDLNSAYHKLDEWKNELANNFQIYVPSNDKESCDVVIFGGLIAWFLSEVGRRCSFTTTLCAHFHEWLSGVALMFAKRWNRSLSTIFTTHATLMGRHLSAANLDLYNNLSSFNIDKEAGDRKIYHNYCIERGAAHTADIFTTVSNITGDEAAAFIGRRPDIITPNGLNVVKYTVMHEFQNMHVKSKMKINNFVQGHFSGNIDFDLDKTLYVFTAGRYEFRNKGVDFFLEALYRLNKYLKLIDSDITIVVFLIFPTKTNNHNVESLRGQALHKQLLDTVNEIKNKIGDKLLNDISRRQIPVSSELLDQEDVMKIKKYLISSKSDTFPPICTHNIVDDANDPILQTLRGMKMYNTPSDRVKIIYHPEFLNSTSALFPMDYEDFVRGCHLGIFCSYYEPWGYTPAECTGMGVPSITTNLSGFGEYMQEKVNYPKNYGIYIVDRRFVSYEEGVCQLVDYIIDFSSQTRRQRIIQRNRCERLSELIDWKLLGKYYTKARKAALHKVHPNIFTPSDEQVQIEESLSLGLRRCLSLSNFTVDDDYNLSCYDTDDAFHSTNTESQNEESPDKSNSKS